MENDKIMGLYTALCNMTLLNRRYYLNNNEFSIKEIEECIEDMGCNTENFENTESMLEFIKKCSALSR